MEEERGFRLQLFGQGAQAGEAGGGPDGTQGASGETGKDCRGAQELPGETRQISEEAREPEEQEPLE